MRIRTIKPEFWTDKRVSDWDHFTRLLYIGTWSAADDYGRGSAEPARIAAELFPYDLSRDSRETLANVSRGFAKLSEASRIMLYEVSGERFFQIVNWTKHQRVDKPGKSRIPEPSEADKEAFATLSRHSRDTLATGTGSREQGAGTEEQGAGSGGVGAVPPVPQTKPEPEKESEARFTPPTLEEATAYGKEIALPESEAAGFVDYFTSNGWRVGRAKMKSWKAAMRNWHRNWVGKQPKRYVNGMEVKVIAGLDETYYGSISQKRNRAMGLSDEEVGRQNLERERQIAEQQKQFTGV